MHEPLAYTPRQAVEGAVRAKGKSIAAAHRGATAPSLMDIEDRVLAYLAREGGITNVECRQLCDLSPYQVPRRLSRLATEGKLEAIGEKRWCYYVLPEER